MTMRPAIIIVLCLATLLVVLRVLKVLEASRRPGARAPGRPPIPTLPRTKSAPAPVVFYFVATAVDKRGLESDYSTEVVYTNKTKSRTVTLAWDRSPGTNAITNYNVFSGRVSGTYTNKYAAGTNLTLTVPLASPALTNFVVTVTTTGATNIAWAPRFDGPWTMLNTNRWSGTNVPAPRFFRSVKAGSKVFITGRAQ